MSRFRTPGRLIAAGLAIGLVAASGSLLAGSAPAQAAELPDAQRWAPSRLPDRITLTPGEDPTTEQVIAWRSSTAVTDGIVQYRTLTPEPYPDGILSLTAQERHEQTTDLGYTQVTHTATLSGLVPGTAYMYRVGDGTNFSEWQDFETATAEGGNYSFIYLGDVQNGILSDASRVIRNAFRDRPNADLVVQAGDLVNDAHSDAQWGELYDAFSYTLGTQNLLTTPGNHEYDGVLSTQYRNQFSFPDTGPAGEGAVYDALEGTVYYVDYENTRFVTLNSNVSDTEGLEVQRAWLEGVLSNNPQTWTVVMFHHPVYSLDEGRNNLGIRQSWGPLFEQYNVDLVLTGHDHAYGRGNTNASEQNLPEGADAELSHTGPVYVTSSVGSKFYTAGPRHWNENDAHLRRLVQGMETYQLVDVSSGSLRFESRTADGAFLDGFTITKNDGQKLVVDGVEPQVIDPGDPGTCLGCGENPDPDPVDPGEEVPSGDFSYEATGSLVSVSMDMARLPASVAYHEGRDVLYLGDQNGKSIFEIDPDTDAVLRTIELPENIRDLGIDEQRELLYVGQQNRNWVVVSIADANFGEVVRGSYPIIESNRSLDVDPVNDYVYVAVPSRGVEVFRASTGESLGVVNGTGDAYYVAADPATGMIVTTKFYDVEGAIGIQAFDASNGFVKIWERSVRPGARQVDIDSTHGLLYIGYTGTSETGGGFSVHDLKTGGLKVDMVGATYGKDGYGIAVDEEHQRVFVANRDFRLNPPGDETTPVAVTVSTRILDDAGEPGDGGSGDGGSGDGGSGDGGSGDGGSGTEAWTATALTSLPIGGTDMGENPDIRPVGSVVDPATGYLYLADEMRPARIHVIDPATDTELRVMTAPTGDPVEDGLRDIALDPEKGWLYVAYSGNWIVMDAETGERIAGPYSLSGSARGMDIDVEGGRLFAATRGSGFEVRDLTNGDLVTTVEGPTDAGAWRSHGIAYDAVNDLIYVSNSDAGGSTEGIRVYSGTDYTLQRSLAYDGADFRSIAVDGEAGIVVVGHQSITFDDSGASVYSASDLSLIKRLSEYQYGNKVYGVSIDADRDVLYVSARDRYPAALIAVTLGDQQP